MVQDLVHNLCESLVENIGCVSGATSRKVVVATPVITLTGNSVTITCATTGATIYYTLDGSTPTSSSSQYSSAFTLGSSCTIKAIAIKGGKSSGIAEEEYVKPITYLTQWKLMGNSEVHTDEYLTQWKVEGNSVVDNNAILSCGDLGQDGKYHVKISNGVTIYDIPLTEPLRKVNDVVDSIELVNGTAIVTRNIAKVKWNDLSLIKEEISSSNYNRFYINNLSNNIYLPSSSAERKKICLSSDFSQDNAPIIANISVNSTDQCMCVYSNGTIYIRDTSVNSAAEFQAKYGTHEFLYRLATPTTEVIQVSPFPVSPTDTYTSANDTPYSAFEYKKNVEIWSCGEYSEVDNKWHIRILPKGYGIVDIALDEPLRKVNDVADTIEFANGVATLTRNLASTIMSDIRWYNVNISSTDKYRYYSPTLQDKMKVFLNNQYAVMLCPIYDVKLASPVYMGNEIGIASNFNGIYLYDDNYDSVDDLTAFLAHINGVELIYELATPTTETIQVPQIQDADSYTCVISQGGKAVEWSSFETE